MLEQIENCRGIELSSRDFKTVAISVTRAKLYCIIDLKTVVYSSRSRNSRGIELSSRDFKTVAISVTRAKLYCINTWFACTSPSPEAQSPAGNLASAYPPKPLLFTLLGVGACDMLEQIENCQGIELSSRDFKTVAISVTRAKPKNCRAYRAYRETVEVSNYRAGTSKLSQYQSLKQRLKTVEHIEHIEKLSRYRTIEEGLENCRNIGHLSKA